MDEQHHKIIDIANELYRAVFAIKGGPGEDQQAEIDEGIKKSMRGAVDYVKTHFSTEEEMQRKIEYPTYHEHKARHDEFTRRIIQDVVRFEAGDKRVGLQLVAFLRDWLLEHIAVVDKELARYARTKGIK
jgi:hemerythrin